MKQQNRPRPRGMRVMWILVAAGAVGATSGVGLALRHDDEEDHTMAVADQQARRTVPMGAPLPAPPGAPNGTGDISEPEPASLEGISPYPHAGPRALGHGLESRGSKLSISWFSTRDTPSEVLAYYDRDYTKRNMVHATHLFDDDQGYVAWLDADPSDGGGTLEGTLHMISVAKSGHETLVFLSSSRPHEILDSVGVQLPPGVRLPDGASKPVVINLGEQGVRRLGIHSFLDHGTVRNTADYFLDYLKTGGWTLVEHTEGDGREGITASRENVLQSVMISKRDEGVDMMLSYDARGPEVNR